MWVVEGPPARDMGMMFPTRMTIIKLSNGALWFDSPVSVSQTALNEIKALGRIEHLVAGTPRHLWRLESWHNKFPDARMWGPPQVLGGPVARFMIVGRTDLPFAGILNGAPRSAWSRDIDQIVFEGNPLIREVIFFHKKSHTLILDDLIQNYQPKANSPLRNAVFRLEGVAAPNGGVPGDIRLTFVNRKAARRSLRKLLSWNFDKLIIAHGACVEKNAKQFVERAFEWLIR